jgi:predicted Zn finger-like uncharacterized protein
MSLITRCPACGTMFKVVPDQLRISEGWVRCGHCAEVFDASAHLQADVPAAPEAAVIDVPSNTGQAPQAGAADVSPAVRELDAPHGEPEEFASSLNTELEEGEPLDALDSAQLEAEAQALRETPMDRPFELRRQDIADEADEAAEPLPPRFTPLPDSELEPELHDLSFVRQARSQEFWSRPGIRVMLALLVVVLSLLLVAQVGVHDRDRLAAAHPALRPWITLLCAPIKCRIAPARQIDSIVIDSSSFNKLRGDAYRLNFTLKNQAANQVAMPALELTLTDGQEQPVVRRVLLPAELGTHPGVIAAKAEWSGSLALSLSANGNGNDARIAGYRLLAFYP